MLWAESRPGAGFALLDVTGQPSLLPFPVTQEDKSQKEVKKELWFCLFYFLHEEKEGDTRLESRKSWLKSQETYTPNRLVCDFWQAISHLCAFASSSVEWDD